MTEEQLPSGEAEVAASSEEREGEATDEDLDEDLLDLEEPKEATRLSPFAVAAFVLSLLGLFRAPQFIQPGPVGGLEDVVRNVLPQAVIPAAAAVIVLWLVRRAEDEIFFGDSRFGGVGLYRSARVIAIVTLTICVLALAIAVFITPDPPMRFG